MLINAILFDNFTSLDLFGPVDILARVPDTQVRYYSLAGGPVVSSQGSTVLTESAGQAQFSGALLVPGGLGTRMLSWDGEFLAALRRLADAAPWCLSVCTGSVLLAACGALHGKRATSNKCAFEWVRRFPGVLWQPRARWVADGKFYTSSGVAAGMDMALGFVRDRHGRELAEQIAWRMEYCWNSDEERDPFAAK